MTVAERIVEVNGQPCRVWEKGRGSPVYYLAGIAGLPRWTPFLDRLAERHRVVVPSLPGYPGATGHDQLDGTLDWITAALDLLDAAGLDGGDLIGASVGGTLAAEVASLSPGRVRRLVLIAPFGLYDKETPPLDVWALKPGTLPSVLSADAQTFGAFTAPPEGVAPAEWAIVMMRASEAAARLLWPLADTRLARRLHRIRAETLILWGGEDKVLSPRYAERFAKGISGKTRVTIVPGAGHLVDLDAPERAAEAVLETIA
ncbi:MAG TPA: alpha/beta fold hydrolase [Stellaceae bacterium]|nr:alpha/beta fold hydrolase [Stellaceae bacterium]